MESNPYNASTYATPCRRIDDKVFELAIKLAMAGATHQL